MTSLFPPRDSLVKWHPGWGREYRKPFITVYAALVVLAMGLKNMCAYGGGDERRQGAGYLSLFVIIYRCCKSSPRTWSWLPCLWAPARRWDLWWWTRRIRPLRSPFSNAVALCNKKSAKIRCRVFRIGQKNTTVVCIYWNTEKSSRDLFYLSCCLESALCQ